MEGQGVAHEAKRLIQLGLPAAAGGVLLFTSRLIITAKVGHLGSLPQSQLALAHTTYNITGLSWVVGICTAVQTFIGAAHGAGAGSLKGVILQRGIVIGLLTALFPLLLWTRVPALLQLLGQQPEIAAGAAAYIWHVCPALLLSVVFYCIMCYLQAQRVVWQLAGVMATSACLCTPLLCYLYISKLGWGVVGAAATVLSTHSVEVLLLVGVTAWHNARQPPDMKPWGGFSSECFRAWLPYLGVAIPCCIMICLDWWALEGLTLIAGLLPDAQTALAAMGICYGLRTTVFFVIDGIATAVTVRVANALGANRPEVARLSVMTGLVLGLASMLACITPLWAVPQAVARVFTSDGQVAGAVVACLPALCVTLVGDSIATVLSGAIRGAGRQLLGSGINLCAFWVVGLPLSAALALHWQLGPVGLWLGMAIISSLRAVVMAVVMLLLLDWEAEAARSKYLVRSQASSPADRLVIGDDMCAGLLADECVEDGLQHPKCQQPGQAT